MTICVICGTEGANVKSAGADRYQINCAGCGMFEMTGSATRTLELTPFSSQRQIANVRGWVRENQSVLITSDDLRRLMQLETPSVGERAEKLLRAISKRSPNIGAEVEVIGPQSDAAFWLATSWSENQTEVNYLIRKYLEETKQWLERRKTDSALLVRLSPTGYDYLERLRLGGHELDTGFCAMWFAPEVSAIWSDAIEPAIKEAGYKAVRIDGVEHNNKIDDEILANIRRSRFVVADFTGERGGVYFEAGFALGLGRQVIWTVREDALAKIHFDNRQYNFLVWKPDDIADFRTRLGLRIEATIGLGPLVA